MCRATFEPATTERDSGSDKAASLPAYTDPIKPSAAGDYRVLKNEAGATALAGLDPGEYLVDGSGKVAYKIEENFPATLKVDPVPGGCSQKD